MADVIELSERGQFITRHEYRQDIEPLREKVQQLSESHTLTVSLVKTISEDLKIVANNTKALNDSYAHWLAIKKITACIISVSLGVSIILFTVDYSGWLRVINRYLNG
jgi:hypothetical protein